MWEGGGGFVWVGEGFEGGGGDYPVRLLVSLVYMGECEECEYGGNENWFNRAGVLPACANQGCRSSAPEEQETREDGRVAISPRERGEARKEKGKK